MVNYSEIKITADDMPRSMQFQHIQLIWRVRKAYRLLPNSLPEKAEQDQTV